MKKLTKILFALLLMISVSSVNALNLATQPLTTQGSVVPPNLIFILDDSGSMNSDYIPDYVNDSPGFCRTTTGSFTTQCKVTDPPYMSYDFNKIYYNPAIQYDAPKLSTGVSMPAMNSVNTAGWTKVEVDGYKIQWNSQLNIVTGYPDKKWCNGGTCLFNTGGSNAYQYPDATYTTGSAVTGNPYYYTIQASEYCTTLNLKNCISTNVPTGQYTFPAKVRWCTSSSSQTDCQATKVGSYQFVHYATAGGLYAQGSLTVGSSGSTDSVSITSVKVDGVEVMGTTITATTGTSTAANQNAIATAIAAAINSKVSSPEYTATAVGNSVNIKPTLTGLGPNGFVVAVTTPSTTQVGTGTKASGGSVKFNYITGSAKVNNIKVGTVDIMGSSVSPTSSANAATLVAAKINTFTSSPDYVAVVDSVDNTKVNITASAVGTASNGAITAAVNNTSRITATVSGSMAGGTNATTVSMPVTTTNFAGGAVGANSFARVDIVSTNNSYPYFSGRSCASGIDCTYVEEMTNFANWYAYYRTRMQMMKSAVGLSFQPIDSKYNVGYFTINNNVTGDNVDIKTFDDAQKLNWYTQLYKAKPNNSTPLREALSKAGQIYGGKKPAGFTDPVLFSCQQNFTILSTDGYWNGTTGYQMGGANMANVDNVLTAAPRPFFDGGAATNASNTLADVAYYYYNYDLRNGVDASPASVKPPFKYNFSNTTNTSGKTTDDVSIDNVADPSDPEANWQHMTTFTMGLGIDGVMDFSPSYTSDTSGDYFDVKNGTTANPASGICSWQTTGACNWPKPASDSQNNIDDLWHAAVSGHGTYFSASNPKQVAAGLSNALTKVKQATGSSSASATSSPNITATDNFIFSSTFRTVAWDGEVIAQTVDPITGLVGLSTKDPITGQITLDTTPLWVASTWLDASVHAASDDRKILTSDLTSVPNAKNFDWSGLSTEQPLFASKGSLLYQYLNTLSPSLPAPSQQDIANDGQALVNYLRGQKEYEGSIFRARTHALGDTVNSVPSYVKVPVNNYAETSAQPGYAAFKNTARDGMLYIGANDGMLHAFDAVTGTEKWAFVPHTTMPNMYKLADQAYAHQYFVDGSPTVADVYDGAAWRSILVGGFNHGGKGYYALDVTNPAINPKSLWEMCTTASLCNVTDANIGWSYGNPVVTKLTDGTWVVLVTSGYESTGNYLYVIDAITGQIYHKVSVPGANGLSKITPFAPNADADNTALLVYGGDLDGNLWRFNFTSATKANAPTVMKFATFPGQPITTKPEVGLVEVRTDDFRIVVSVATGKYIETTDLNSPPAQQSLYALVDNGIAYASAITSLKQRIISGNTVTIQGSGANSTALGDADWEATWNPDTAFGGWYVDFPSLTERVNLDPQLVLGTLVVTTNSPDSTVSCGSSGGVSSQYQFSYDTGLAVNPNNPTSIFVSHYQDLAVGLAIYTTPDGNVHGHSTYGGGSGGDNKIDIAKGPKSKRNALRSLRR